MSEQRDESLDFYQEESYVRSYRSPGSLLTFNIAHGYDARRLGRVPCSERVVRRYLEGVFRGFRSGFLTVSHYRQLCQCETLDDVKLTLTDTDYAAALQALQAPKLTPEMIVDVCGSKLNQVCCIRLQQCNLSSLGVCL